MIKQARSPANTVSNAIFSILKGCLVIFTAFLIHSFFLSFVTYILIEEKIIEGGTSRGYFEIIKLGFQHSKVTQWPIAAFITLLAGFIWGLPRIITGIMFISRKNKQHGP